MSAAGITQPLTARMFLTEDSQGPDIAEVIATSLHERGIAGSAIQSARRLSNSALRTVYDEISTVVDGFLELKLGDILVSGWRKYTELINAAQRTLASPGSKEVVVLAAHQVSSTHHPTVELLIDKISVCTLVFDLTVVFNLTGVVAVVQQGELTTLRSGECELTVTLGLEGKPVLPSRKANVNLGRVVALNPSIPLLREARR